MEHLHEMVEQHLNQFVEEASSDDARESVETLTSKFVDLRKNLLSLTDVTHSYFEKFVRQLELGFDTISQIYTAGNTLSRIFSLF